MPTKNNTMTLDEFKDEHYCKRGTLKREKLEKRYIEFKKEEIIQDKSLDKYDDVVLFPDKLAKANEMLRTIGLPSTKKKLRRA